MYVLSSDFLASFRNCDRMMEALEEITDLFQDYALADEQTDVSPISEELLDLGDSGESYSEKTPKEVDQYK